MCGVSVWFVIVCAVWVCFSVVCVCLCVVCVVVCGVRGELCVYLCVVCVYGVCRCLPTMKYRHYLAKRRKPGQFYMKTRNVDQFYS